MKWKVKKLEWNECENCIKAVTNIGTFKIYNDCGWFDVYLGKEIIYMCPSLSIAKHETQQYYEKLITDCFTDSEFKEVKELEWTQRDIKCTDPDDLICSIKSNIHGWYIIDIYKQDIVYYNVKFQDNIIMNKNKIDNINDAMSYIEREFQHKIMLNLESVEQETQEQDVIYKKDELKLKWEQSPIRKNTIYTQT